MNYGVNVDRYIAPRIGSIPLQSLRSTHIEAMYADLTESGARNGRGLSVKSVHNVHVLLHRALKDAVKRQLIPRNPAEDTHSLRGSTRPTMKVWDAEQLGAFLASVRKDRLYGLWHLAAMTGMRRGEVLGLRWEDVDLNAA